MLIYKNYDGVENVMSQYWRIHFIVGYAWLGNSNLS